MVQIDPSIGHRPDDRGQGPSKAPRDERESEIQPGEMVKVGGEDGYRSVHSVDGGTVTFADGSTASLSDIET